MAPTPEGHIIFGEALMKGKGVISGRNISEKGTEVGEHRTSTECAPEHKNPESGCRRYSWAGWGMGSGVSSWTHLNITLSILDFGI